MGVKLILVGSMVFILAGLLYVFFKVVSLFNEMEKSKSSKH